MEKPHYKEEHESKRQLPNKTTNREDKIRAKELHKQPKLKFRHKLTTARSIDDVWAADIIDMAGLVDRDFRYMLTVIDVLSRFARVVAIKDKKKETVTKAFHLMFASRGNSSRQAGRKPNAIWTDRGGEFDPDSLGVPVKFAYGPIKVGIIERFNKTLKTRMWYKMTKHRSEAWVDRMPKIVRKYNDTIHSSIGMTPRKAHDGGPEMERILLERQHIRKLKNKYKYNNGALDLSRKLSKQLFDVGDRVRIVNPPPKSGDMFKKGYRPRWSEEIFIITRVIPSSDGPFTYSVERAVPLPPAKRKNIVDKPVMQNYYNEELQKTEL